MAAPFRMAAALCPESGTVGMVNPRSTKLRNPKLTFEIQCLQQQGRIEENDMAYPRHSTVSEAIKRAGLPQSHDINWTDARKAEVVRAVRDRLISFDEARWRYLLSRKEFESWERKLDRSASPPRRMEKV